MDITSTAIEGLNRAEEKLQSVATKLARSPIAESGQPKDTVDLSAAAVEMMDARNKHAVNVKVIETAEEMSKHLLDILA
jgi:flagellar hook protein FlgE